jgi:PDZ domain-containing protein
MKARSRYMWNVVGVIWTLVCIAGVELIWVFDPVRVGNGLYWLDMLEYVIRALLIGPFIWMIAAWTAFIGGRRHWGRQLLSLGIMILTCANIVQIIFFPDDMIALGAIYILTFLLVMAELLLEQIIHTQGMPWRGILHIGATLALLAALLWPTSYEVTYPGLTMNMDRYAELQEGQIQTYASDRNGQIMSVLIFERPAVLMDLLLSKLLSPYEITERVQSIGSIPNQLAAVKESKLDANQLASAIAFKKLGLGKGAIYKGVRVVAIQPDSPVSGALQSGDVITQLNGIRIAQTAELIDTVSETPPGTEVELEIKRDGTTQHIKVFTAAHPTESNRSILGIQIMNVLELDVPYQVDFKPYILHEGGPSHGAMLTLAIINKLTPGGVLNGHLAAGTGTIDLDGSVGRIGGIEQKAYTVSRTNADVFFVPSTQYEDARKGSLTLNIVPVDHIDDILQWLQNN